MQKILKQSVGVDTSKEKLALCFSEIDYFQKVTVKGTRSFANTLSGFEAVSEWVAKFRKQDVPLQFLMEATGVYHEQFALYLHKQGQHVSVILPTKAKKYSQSLGLKSKNDKIDSKGLSRMSAEQSLEPWQPLSEYFYTMRTLTREIESIHKVKTMLNNQHHALQHSMVENPTTAERLESHIQLLADQIKAIEKELEQMVKSNPEVHAKVQKIAKVKGLGLLSIATILAETNGFALFENQRQLVSYAGYDIVEKQSGVKTGATQISKKGNSHIRRILHLPALNTVRYKEGKFESDYNKLIGKGKKKMQAYVAVQRKLLILIYTLWKKNEDYNPKYQKTSGNDEPKPLFSLGSEGDVKKIALENSRATVDELPCNESPEALFSLKTKL